MTVSDGIDNRHAGIEVHRSRLITRNDCLVRNGVLVTKSTWTVAALAAVLSPTDLRGTTRDALGLKLVSVRSILVLLDRLGPTRGSRILRDILARSLPTRSELEDLVLDVIIRGGFVVPEVNEPLMLGGKRVIPDFRWPDQRVVLEADGARWHSDALARADDSERQALLEANGETVLRVRWDQAVHAQAGLRTRLAEAGVPLG